MSLKYINFIASSDQEELQSLIKKSLISLDFEFDNIHENLFRIEYSSTIIQEKIKSFSDELLGSNVVSFLSKINAHWLEVDRKVDSVYYKIPGIGGLFEKMDRFADRIGDDLDDKIDEYFDPGSSCISERRIDITLNSLNDETNVVFSSKDRISKSDFYCYFFLIKRELLEIKEIQLSDFVYSEKLKEIEKGEIDLIEDEEKEEDLHFEFSNQIKKVDNLELEVKKLISKNRIVEAITRLEDFFKVNDIELEDDVVLLRFQFERIKGMEINGLATQEEISVNLNKLIISMLKFIDRMVNDRDLIKMIK